MCSHISSAAMLRRLPELQNSVIFVSLIYDENMTQKTNGVAFSKPQREAIVSLLVEMVNIDDVVAFGELVTANSQNDRLGVTDDDFVAGRKLGMQQACEIVAGMSDEQKIVLGKLLVEAIDADGRVDSREVALLESIGRATGLDTVFP